MEREKVINGLEWALENMVDPFNDFRFAGYDGTIVILNEPIVRDALSLLKAQEPVKPVMHYVPDGKRSSAAWQCGNCLIDIGYGANYCYNCGRAVKWK